MSGVSIIAESADECDNMFGAGAGEGVVGDLRQQSPTKPVFVYVFLLTLEQRLKCIHSRQMVHCMLIIFLWIAPLQTAMIDWCM